jgi:hypothetical protein
MSQLVDTSLEFKGAIKAAEPISHARRIFRVVESVERRCDV